MKLYRDTINHYRANVLDDLAACGADMIGRRNEDQLDPFNTTCRDCLLARKRHHSCFQNLDNYFTLLLNKEIVSIEDLTKDTSDAFDRILLIRFDDKECWDVQAWFDQNWALDNMNLV